MAIVDVCFQTKNIGNSIKQEILLYYGLTGDLSDFNWKSIVDYQSDGIKINRNTVADTNFFNSKSDHLITDANNYITNPDNVTIDTLLSDTVILYISQSDHAILDQKNTDTLFTKFTNESYHNVTSELFSKYIKDILKDDKAKPFYAPVDFSSSKKDKISLANVSHRVYIVSKALGNKVINASPYIIDSTWNDDFNGGNFSVTLASPTAEVVNGKWTPINVTTTINSFGEMEVLHSDALDNYRIINNDYSSDPVLSFRKLYFDMVLQKYDIVFIRGERLFNESKEINIDTLTDPFEVGKLIGKNWDMIGLIDRTQINYQLQSGLIGFNLSGRDLMAVLIDTQNINIPNVSTSGQNQAITDFLTHYVGNFTEANKSHTVDRLFGSMNELSKITAQPVERQINWIFDKWQHCPFSTDYKLFSDFKIGNPYESFEEKKAISKGEVYERLGIWNLMSVWVDENVKSRYINDSSFNNQNGSNLISYLKKVCQPPIVEFFTIQLGTYFHWVIRKPPFDIDSYKYLYELCNTENSHVVSADMIYNMSLEYDNTDIGSIFRFVPTESLLNTMENQWVFPSLCIPELMDRFDLKMSEISHNYFDMNHIPDALFKDTLRDLEFYIRTTVYKQFSQKGTITILGNRIIKKGQAIYLEPLDLLCYVTGVSNQFSINETSVQRSTVLTVERCIRMKYYSLYFNIVDFRNLRLSTQTGQKDLKLLKNDEGVPFVYEFFEKKLDQDYDHYYSGIVEKTNDILLNTLIRQG